MMAEQISMELWLAELAKLLPPTHRKSGFFLAREIMEAKEAKGIPCSRNRLMTMLRRAVETGEMECSAQPMPDISGRVQRLTMYRRVAKKRSKR